MTPDRDGKQPSYSHAGEDGGPYSNRPRLGGRSAVADYIRSLPEEFAGWMLAIYLDRDFVLLALDRIRPETSEKYCLKPMEFVRRGHKLGAVGFVLAHYAPDRITKAWPGELAMSREIRRAGEDFNIHLLDHIVIGRDRLFEIDP